MRRGTGDGRALVGELEPGLRRLIFRYTRDAHAVEDLLQETYLRVIRSLDRYHGRAALRTWAWAIARNLCLDHVRSRARSRLRLVESFEAADRESEPDRRLDLEERRREVDRALSALAPEARELLVLRVYDGLSYREIARTRRIPATGVGARLSRALRSLSSKLG
jgi:RNA polymerase sigma-70 factor (ECF subfamily)